MGAAPYWFNPPFLIFDIRVLWHQCVWMSKIKNGGSDQYGKCKALTGSAVKGLTYSTHLKYLWQPASCSAFASVQCAQDLMILTSKFLMVQVFSMSHLLGKTLVTAVRLKGDNYDCLFCIIMTHFVHKVSDFLTLLVFSIWQCVIERD